uniref:EF-hand domain-containing protein n=1 Tax=Picea sitchensis TaxID=3332 RepID=A9P0Q5_PICSI|nr:unknown [Picea sitchensis]
MEDKPSEASLQTVAARAPITAQRRLNTHLQEQMPVPYLARALEAVDPEHINGSTDYNNNNMSVLQQHCAFFDKDKDGIIYPSDTYKGFRAIGFNVILTLVATVIIHVAFSYYTLPGWIPSLKLPIYIDNIHNAKHGSDTEGYDTEGRFVPDKFDAIFSKYATKEPNKLTFMEIQCMLKANRNSNDPLGWGAAELEWVFLYLIAKNKEGFLEKESIRRMFDGSLWEILAKQNSSRKRR